MNICILSWFKIFIFKQLCRSKQIFFCVFKKVFIEWIFKIWILYFRFCVNILTIFWLPNMFSSFLNGSLNKLTYVSCLKHNINLGLILKQTRNKHVLSSYATLQESLKSLRYESLILPPSATRSKLDEIWSNVLLCMFVLIIFCHSSSTWYGELLSWFMYYNEYSLG